MEPAENGPAQDTLAKWLCNFLLFFIYRYLFLLQVEVSISTLRFYGLHNTQ